MQTHSRFQLFKLLIILLVITLISSGCTPVPDEDDVRELVEARFQKTENKLALKQLEVKGIFKQGDQYWAQIEGSFICKFSDYYDFPPTDMIKANTYGTNHAYDFSSYLKLDLNDGDWIVAEASRNPPL